MVSGALFDAAVTEEITSVGVVHSLEGIRLNNNVFNSCLELYFLKKIIYFYDKISIELASVVLNLAISVFILYFVGLDIILARTHICICC